MVKPRRKPRTKALDECDSPPAKCAQDGTTGVVAANCPKPSSALKAFVAQRAKRPGNDSAYGFRCGVCSGFDDPLVCCTACRDVFHLHCVGLSAVPAGDWVCASCEQGCLECFSCRLPVKIGHDLVACSHVSCAKVYHRACARKLLQAPLPQETTSVMEQAMPVSVPTPVEPELGRGKTKKHYCASSDVVQESRDAARAAESDSSFTTASVGTILPANPRQNGAIMDTTRGSLYIRTPAFARAKSRRGGCDKRSKCKPNDEQGSPMAHRAGSGRCGRPQGPTQPDNVTPVVAASPKRRGRTPKDSNDNAGRVHEGLAPVSVARGRVGTATTKEAGAGGLPLAATVTSGGTAVGRGEAATFASTQDGTPPDKLDGVDSVVSIIVASATASITNEQHPNQQYRVAGNTVIGNTTGPLAGSGLDSAIVGKDGAAAPIFLSALARNDNKDSPGEEAEGPYLFWELDGTRYVCPHHTCCAIMGGLQGAPPPYVHIRRNQYLTGRRPGGGGGAGRKRKDKEDEDEEHCACTAQSCAVGDCVCRSLLTACASTCACGPDCTRDMFRRPKMPRIEVFKTPLCGHGVRARQDIPEDTFIIEYVGEVIDDAECEARLWQRKAAGEVNFYLCELSREMVIDASLKGNLSRHINHGCDPNCRIEKWNVGTELRVGVFACRDIKQGEELKYDYKFDSYGPEQACHCGAAICRGTLGAKPITRRPTTIRERVGAAIRDKVEAVLAAGALGAGKGKGKGKLPGVCAWRDGAVLAGRLDKRLVNQAVQVYWPSDGEFFRGIVTAYDAKTGMHKVCYEDGDTEDLVMSQEQFQVFTRAPRGPRPKAWRKPAVAATKVQTKEIGKESAGKKKKLKQQLITELLPRVVKGGRSAVRVTAKGNKPHRNRHA
eukprot:jgi/Mesvir1/8836/Mv02735-RA.1